MKHVWKMLLRLYPPAHRASFAAEMEEVFEQAAEERRRQGWLSFAGFLLAELFGLLLGAGAAWTRETRSRGPNGDPVAKTKTLIEANLRRMEHAIWGGPLG